MKFLKFKKLKEYRIEELELDIKINTILSLLILGVSITLFVVEMIYRAWWGYPFHGDGFLLASLAMGFSLSILFIIHVLMSKFEIRFRKIEEHTK